MLSYETWYMVKWSIKEYTGIAMTHDQVEELISRSPSLMGEIAENGLDTEARSGVLDAVTQDLLGQNMPLRGDDIDQNEFFEKLHEAALKAGYDLSDSI